MDKRLFSHTTQLRVRNYELDWQGIVHNATYLLYFEVGRIDYLKRIGVHVDLNSIRGDSRIVLVKNEIEYRSSARFDDMLHVHSRVSYVKNSSFAFEGIIELGSTGALVAENRAIHVWLDPRTSESMRVPDEFRKKVKLFEGENVDFIPERLVT